MVAAGHPSSPAGGVCLLVDFFICLFVGFFVGLFVGLFVDLFVGLFVGLFVLGEGKLFSLLICLFADLFVCWFVYWLVCFRRRELFRNQEIVVAAGHPSPPAGGG